MNMEESEDKAWLKTALLILEWVGATTALLAAEWLFYNMCETGLKLREQAVKTSQRLGEYSGFCQEIIESDEIQAQVRRQLEEIEDFLKKIKTVTAGWAQEVSTVAGESEQMLETMGSVIDPIGESIHSLDIDVKAKEIKSTCDHAKRTIDTYAIPGLNVWSGFSAFLIIAAPPAYVLWMDDIVRRLNEESDESDESILAIVAENETPHQFSCEKSAIDITGQLKDSGVVTQDTLDAMTTASKSIQTDVLDPLDKMYSVISPIGALEKPLRTVRDGLNNVENVIQTIKDQMAAVHHWGLIEWSINSVLKDLNIKNPVTEELEKLMKKAVDDLIEPLVKEIKHEISGLEKQAFTAFDLDEAESKLKSIKGMVNKIQFPDSSQLSAIEKPVESFTKTCADCIPASSR